MSVEDVTKAIDTVARRLLYKVVDQGLDHGVVDWEDFPEIGEFDWDKVCLRARAIADEGNPHKYAYEEAYQVLAERAAGYVESDEPEPGPVGEARG